MKGDDVIEAYERENTPFCAKIVCGRTFITLIKFQTIYGLVSNARPAFKIEIADPGF